MRFYLDTEFIESGAFKPIHLISIGIVAEDGREFYGINSECPLEDASDWVKANVLPHLESPGAVREAGAGVEAGRARRSSLLVPSSA